MKNRAIKEKLIKLSKRKYNRILVLTGARQTGKTTLIKQAFPDIPYISVEDPVVRPSFTRISAVEWATRYPIAIIDEIQKAPSIIESIKAAYDLSNQVRYMILGSSQILLLIKIKESLAGRAYIQELYPLTIPEMLTDSWENEIRESVLIS
jgi:predicted AAA+ superfamily ATPase